MTLLHFVTIPNCHTLTLRYTPQSPTVTLSQARLRHVAVYGSSFQCEGSDLRVASPFRVGRSRSESNYKDFFVFPEMDLVLSGAISDQSIDVPSNMTALTYATCSLVA